MKQIFSPFRTFFKIAECPINTRIGEIASSLACYTRISFNLFSAITFMAIYPTGIFFCLNFQNPKEFAIAFAADEAYRVRNSSARNWIGVRKFIVYFTLRIWSATTLAVTIRRIAIADRVIILPI